MKKLKLVSLILFVMAIILIIYTGWRQWIEDDSIMKAIHLSLALVMIIISCVTNLIANELKKLEEKMKRGTDKLRYAIKDGN